MSETTVTSSAVTSSAVTSTGTAASNTAAATTDATTTTTTRARRAHLALRALQIVLALFYGVVSAGPKLIADPSAVESFDTMGWGNGAMYTIGALELAGAIALVIPLLASVSAVALSALMIGAFITQVTAFDGQYAATPLILIVPLVLIAWARRHRTAELLRLLRPRA